MSPRADVRREYRGYVATEHGRVVLGARAPVYLEQARATLAYFRACLARRAAIREEERAGRLPLGVGYYVHYTSDPEWLVDMVVNRRAGWPDDPGHTRGSAMPVGGRYPKKASGDAYRHLCLIAHEVNSRQSLSPQRLGEWREFLLARIPQRFYWPDGSERGVD